MQAAIMCALSVYNDVKTKHCPNVQLWIWWLFEMNTILTCRNQMQNAEKKLSFNLNKIGRLLQSLLDKKKQQQKHRFRFDNVWAKPSTKWRTKQKYTQQIPCAHQNLEPNVLLIVHFSITFLFVCFFFFFCCFYICCNSF